jgi:sensor histidine kinase YesM
MEHPIMSTDEAVIPLVFLLYIEWKPVYIAVFLRQGEIENYLSSAFASLDRVFIVNSEGENILNYIAADREVVSMFSGEESENANAVCREIRYLGEPYLASYTRMALSRWDIYTLKSSASLLANIGTIQKFVVLFWGLTVITGVVLAFLFSRSITRQEEQQKRIAELKALQAQIKPHFLYNTLNDISWHASDQGASEIAMMANSLGRFFRIGLSKGRELITVREELDHVLSYLVIQSIRYKSKLEYSVNIPEELKTYEIIKLVLQPLVENALYHGIKTLERKGYIRIHGKKEKSTGGIPILTFTITDNGAGMDTAKLRMINDNLSRGLIESSSGYGVYSVNERIRLYYGESYGLRLENTAGSSGICAKITIPCRSPEEAPC